jgi:hypothetical protein
MSWRGQLAGPRLKPGLESMARKPTDGRPDLLLSKRGRHRLRLLRHLRLCPHLTQLRRMALILARHRRVELLHAALETLHLALLQARRGRSLPAKASGLQPTATQ